MREQSLANHEEIKRHMYLLTLFCALPFGFAATGWGGIITGSISGRATGPSGAVAPGAQVTAADSATGVGAHESDARHRELRVFFRAADCERQCAECELRRNPGTSLARRPRVESEQLSALLTGRPVQRGDARDSHLRPVWRDRCLLPNNWRRYRSPSSLRRGFRQQYVLCFGSQLKLQRLGSQPETYESPHDVSRFLHL